MNFSSALSRARAVRRPLLAFNVVDIASLFGVTSAAAEVNEPVILQASARTVKYYGAALLRAAASDARDRLGVNCYLHLDHCTDSAIIRSVIDNQFDGFMIDGSALPYEENVRLTAEWVRAGHAAGLLVEGELGPIRGVEDGAAAATGQLPPTVADCLRFQEATGVDLFGTDIGTAHGLYETAPTLDFPAVEAIAAHGPAAFVVHGGTGLSEDALRRLALLGATKINFSTALKHAWVSAMSHCSPADGGPEPLQMLQAAEAEIEALVRDLFRVFTGGCDRPCTA